MKILFKERGHGFGGPRVEHIWSSNINSITELISLCFEWEKEYKWSVLDFKLEDREMEWLGLWSFIYEALPNSLEEYRKMAPKVEYVGTEESEVSLRNIIRRDQKQV